MATDAIVFTKLESGEAVRVGDVGKSLVRLLTPEATEAELEEHFFYAVDAEDGNAVGEVNDIQIEPTWDNNYDALDAGNSIIYGTGDLL